jgi:uncharacterized small protein (DUF1192 family)
MATEDDDRPRKKISHEIGQDLSLLSVEELTERVTLLKSEIARLEEAAATRPTAFSSRETDAPLSCPGCGARAFLARHSGAARSAEPGIHNHRQLKRAGR